MPLFFFNRLGRYCLPLLGGFFIGAPASMEAREAGEVLRLHWEPGMTYTQETTTDTVTVLTAIGLPDDQKMKVRQTTTIAVTAGEGGEKLARVSFAAIAGEMQIQGRKEAFDSANMAAAHPMIRQSLGESVGQSFVLRYSADDQFLDVRDTGSMVRAPEGIPSFTDIARAKEVAELYRRSLEMGLPKIPVRPGDRWTSKETVEFPKAGTMQVELRAKLDSLVSYQGHPHVKISFEGEMNRANESGSSTADRPVTIEGGSKTSGQILFDLERRSVSFAAFHADLNLDIDGRKVPVRQQVTTRLVKVDKS